MGEVKSKINEVYRPLYLSDRRYLLLTGGRGSLKSTTVHDFIARLTYEKGHGILFTRYTMTSAEKSIIPEFKITLERLQIESDFHITQNTITNLKTGSFIYFSGIKTSSGNQTANLKSIAGITTWVIEEGEDFVDEKAFDAIDNSIRTTNQRNRIIWIQNPTTKEHFIYKRWIKDTNRQINIEGYNVTVSNHKDVEHIHTTYHIGERLGYLAQSWLQKAYDLRDKAEQSEAKEKNSKYRSKYYYDYIGGWLERAEGVIFDYTIGAFDYNLPNCYHLDWGYSPDPLALGRLAVDKRNKKLYCKEYIYATEVNDVPTALINVGLQRKDLIICDTSEPRTRAAIAKAGFNIQNAVKNQIVDDIRAIKEYEIILDPDSPNFKTEFDNYVWNDKKASIPIDKYNHCFVGETLITTNLGKKQIKDIDINDYVLTSKGYRNVLKKFDNGVKEINKYTLLFDTFSLSLSCTKDHKIKTENGWIEISKLTTQTIYLNASSMVKHTNCTLMKDTLVGEQKDFIELCGNTTKELYQKVMTYITLMKTPRTTILKIWDWLKENYTKDLQQKEDLKIIPNTLKGFGKLELKRQKNGISQKKELNGIKCRLKDIILGISHTVKGHAISVIQNMKPKQKNKSFAQINANHNTEETKELITLRKNVNHVQKNTLQANIISQKLVGVCVERIENQRVYDIMVDEDHEYFANGVLVHNCIDGMRYAYNRLVSKSILGNQVGFTNLT